MNSSKTNFALTGTPLNPKQKAFVQAYIQTLNATESYKLAGYAITSNESAMTSACRLLSNVKVQVAIKSYFDSEDIKLKMNVKYVLENLKDIIERCNTEEVDSRCLVSAVKALEIVAKYNGMLDQTITVQHINKSESYMVTELLKNDQIKGLIISELEKQGYSVSN